MLTTQQQQLIQATVPALQQQGLQLTTHFYHRLFAFNPELKNRFNLGNQQSGRQQMALAMAVLAYAQHIDNPAVLGPALTHIGHKHISLDIRPEHYAIVGRHLLASIGEVLGEEATPALLTAWRLAYDQLAQLMIGTEADLYASQLAKPGGWTGWREFIVKTKIPESSEITSFHLYPADGGPIADHQPGQYLSVRLFLPQLGLQQARQYSLSNAPNGLYYRISVKRESGNGVTTDGLISNYLHQRVEEGDRLAVSAPAGVFTLDTSRGDQPIVFLSGGVGQTPLLSMLEHLIETGDRRRPIHWIHGCRNRDVHAFKDTLDYWAATHPNLHQHIFYQEPGATDAVGPIYAGYVDLGRLEDNTLAPDARYYLCGPPVFLTKQYEDLLTRGIAKDAIHWEEFGPQQLVLP